MSPPPIKSSVSASHTVKHHREVTLVRATESLKQELAARENRATKLVATFAAFGLTDVLARKISFLQERGRLSFGSFRINIKAVIMRISNC